MTRPPLVLAGYPFVPIGVGEHLRASIRACRAVGLPVQVLDVYDPAVNQHQRIADPERDAELLPLMTAAPGDGINIFHINGAEVPGVLDRLGAGALERGYNVILPVWELAHYPACWVPWLERFDEVWAVSRFVADALAPVLSRPVREMGQPVEPSAGEALGRRHFGLPEDRFLFLFFFDMASFVGRKNPYAGLAAFRRFLELRPEAPADFVIKLNNRRDGPDFERLKDFIAPFAGRVHLIEGVLTDREIQNLVRLSNCFLSLHRSEGFGRGLAEAMYFSKPVIGTAYSGNLDFMDAECSLLLDYRLVPVAEGAYPFGEGQVWASADVDQAAHHMARLVDDPAFARALGRRAAARIRRDFSYRAIGLNYRARLGEIAGK